MSDKPKRVTLDEARAVAKELYDRLLPFCDKVKVVGSVRRCRPLVGDIELLFIPKLVPLQASLFEGSAVMLDLADAQLNEFERGGYIKKRPNVNGSPCWGKQNKLAVHTASGIPVDFFATTAENWFVALVIRTGGKVTNLRLTTGAIKKGMTLHAYGNGFERIRDGTKIPCHSELDVFKFAGVPYLEPRERP